jgi:hypothetical protein
MSASAAEVGRHVICTDGWRVTMHVEVRRGPLPGPDSTAALCPANAPVSARDLPTGCQQQCSLVVPTVRAPRHLTEPRPSHLRSSRRGNRNAKVERSSRNGHWARYGVAGDTFSPRVFPSDTRARPETRHSLDSSKGALTIPGATTGSKAWTSIPCRRKLLPLLAQRGHLGGR